MIIQVMSNILKPNQLIDFECLVYPSNVYKNVPSNIDSYLSRKCWYIYFIIIDELVFFND
jgi:hypothetical protein